MQDYRKIERGAMIVIKDWLRLKPWEKLMIVTSENHLEEAKALRYCAHKRAKSVDLMVVERRGKHVGVFFDRHEKVFDGYRAVIGATDYSLVKMCIRDRTCPRPVASAAPWIPICRGPINT